MNWTALREQVPGGLRFALAQDGLPFLTGDVLAALADSPTFRAWFNALLAAVPFTAFRWETAGATIATTERPFEFVALDAPSIARKSDPEAFAEHFRTAPDAAAISFPNLSGDSILVVPCPVADPGMYGHLGAFVRGAPEPQRDVLWKLIADTMLGRLGTKPVWLSTAGAGVSWLHVRLDDRPKYYGHAPYKLTDG